MSDPPNREPVLNPQRRPERAKTEGDATVGSSDTSAPNSIGIYERPTGLKAIPPVVLWLIAIIILIVLAVVAYYVFF